jgi:hypothetical protein
MNHNIISVHSRKCSVQFNHLFDLMDFLDPMRCLDYNSAQGIRPLV